MIIETKLGQFTAEKAGQSKDGQPIYRITSIPYAEADPFMPPVLRHNYPQEKLINSLETFCFPQKRILRWPNLFLKHHMMRAEWLPVHDSFSESAFMLNVWTSQIENKKPVLVYIHGGGDSGSGTVPIYDGANLAKQGIVLVTITYRVGLYGYLPIIENGTVNCNREAKDQQTALRWIKNHIEYLGGDPNNITLMGQSGGALSSLNQILNQGDEGLIHKAILCGGSFMQARSLQEGEELYQQFLEQNRLKDFAALSKLNIKQILRLKGRKAMAEIVDNEFFQEAPKTALEKGHYQPIPLLIGFNDDEFSMIELPIYYRAMGIATKAADFQKAIKKKYGVYAEELAAELENEAENLID
ncbi:carboxylesterase family protein [Streptococcus sp. H49]